MKRPALILALCALAVGVGACGGGSAAGTSPRLPAVLSDPGAVPALGEPELFSIERRRGDVAIGETLTVGRDGTAVIVRAGGGGGRRTERCLLGPALTAVFLRDAPLLPAPAPPRRMQPVRDPAIYLVSRDGRHGVFMDGAIPVALRALFVHVGRVLGGREGECRTLIAQRP